MSNNQVKLNYYQVMALAYKINSLRGQNIDYDQFIIDIFLEDVLTKIIYINIDGSYLPDFVIKRVKLYSLSLNVYQYLSKITGIDVTDKEVIKKYYDLINLCGEHEFQMQLIKNNKINNLVKKRVKSEI